MTALADENLGRHLDAAIALADDGGQIHMRLHAALSVILGEFADTCRELLGWGDDQTFELVSGGSTASTEPATALTALAGLLQRSPALQPRPGTRQDLDAVLAADPERRCGLRRLPLALREPLPDLRRRRSHAGGAAGDRPSLLRAGSTRRVRGRRCRPCVNGPPREPASCPGRASGDREGFERALARALRAYPVREDNEHHTVSVPLAVVRRAALEVGRRLAERGQLAAAGDVFFLEAPEVPLRCRTARTGVYWSAGGKESGPGSWPIPGRLRMEGPRPAPSAHRASR